VALTVAVLCLAPGSARAEQTQSPDTTLAFVAGAFVMAAGFMVGSVLLATNTDNRTADNAGWLTMNGGFTVAPIASHAVVGEWGRGLAFAAAPAAAMGGTAALFQVDSGTVVHGSLPEQRVLWSFFLAGLFSGTAGVVDAALARGRTAPVTVAPMIGAGHLGLSVGGTL